MNSNYGLIAVVLLALIVLTAYFKDYAERPLSVDSEQVELVIVPGTSFREVTRQLHEAGIISNRWSWDTYARISGAAHEIKAGEYLLVRTLSPRQLLHKLVQGEGTQFAVTVIEGSTFKQLWEAVQKNDKITKTVSSPEKLLTKLNLKSSHPEGWFFPDTYRFSPGVTDVQFFQHLAQYMQSVLDEEWAKKKPDLPIHTQEEALILASIIEKETTVDYERAMISAVFTTRLRRGMRLQADPTVIYGMGDAYDGNIRRKDLKKDTPYNTYLHKGLPPTPIALPGRASIAAALNPADSEMMFFVAKRDGTHHFSSTYSEHRKAVIRYQLKGCKNCYGGDLKN
ncbi:MAG: endolytic transglycosylase MltG [Gammaproteobacteria bacterium]|nr:endolytic transglycosylase MltG [Gammaproteobacteria bacterium]